MDNKDGVHKRRVRYQGTHPKRYQDKYKELQPEVYSDTVAKIIQKGGTPAGMHIPICVKEILAFLQIKPGQTGLDATLGYGGHSLEMLKQLDAQGHLYTIDVDPFELTKTKARLERLGYGEAFLTTKQLNFADIDQVVPQANAFDFLLADLGISSMQVDNPDRGFSYKKEGPLDLRLNPQTGLTAAERLKNITKEELQGMLTENADEPYAPEIAEAIVAKINAGTDIATTTALRQTIEEALSFVRGANRKETIKKSCQRTFQALRIDVNSEFEVLYAFLEKIPDVLVSGGRAAILTFHSGEDRLVKKAFQHFFREGIYKEISTEVIRPSAEECNRNSRARSAKMRWAIKA